MKAEELFTGDSSKIKVGDTIEFGSYPQENDTPSPIDWYVLKAKDNRVFVLCKDIIKCKSYHEESADITWEDCTLRKWLNGEFLKTAFTEGERNRIICSHNENMINRYFIRGGNDMDDYIFCLSVDETAYVDYYGNVDDYGAHVSNRIIGVCPALWLKLNP